MSGPLFELLLVLLELLVLGVTSSGAAVELELASVTVEPAGGSDAGT